MLPRCEGDESGGGAAPSRWSSSSFSSPNLWRGLGGRDTGFGTLSLSLLSAPLQPRPRRCFCPAAFFNSLEAAGAHPRDAIGCCSGCLSRAGGLMGCVDSVKSGCRGREQHERETIVQQGDVESSSEKRDL